MYNNSAFGRGYREGTVDSLLGQAYQIVKDVHDHLPEIEDISSLTEDNKATAAVLKKFTEVLAPFEPKAGMFQGHDLGEVGVDLTEKEHLGENFLTAITKSYDQINTVGHNIEIVQLLSNHINELKAIAAALYQILAVVDMRNDISKTNSHAVEIRTVSDRIADVAILSSYAEQLKQLADSPLALRQLAESADTIEFLSKHAEAITVCAQNIETYKTAINRLKDAQETLEKTTIADYAGWFPLYGETVDTRVRGKKSSISTPAVPVSWVAPENCWLLVTGSADPKTNYEGKITGSLTYGFKRTVFTASSKSKDNLYVNEAIFMPKGSTIEFSMLNLVTVNIEFLAVYKDKDSIPESEVVTE